MSRSGSATLIPMALLSIALWACNDDGNGNEGEDSDADDTDSENGDLCCPAEKIINCGHRGTGINSADNPYPENTIPSFLKAEEEGAQMIELDVHHAGDGTLVVIHDNVVDTTTDGTGCVGEMTVEQLQELDAAVGTSLEGTGVQIPTLAEALAAISVDVNIEIKVSVGTKCPDPDVTGLATDVIAAIDSDTKNRRIIVSSFSIDVLKEVKKAAPEIYVGLVNVLALSANTAKEAGFDAIHVKETDLNEDNIGTVLATGLDCNVWTVNSPEDIERFFGLGVNMIITDEPQNVESVRTAWCNKQCNDGGV